MLFQSIPLTIGIIVAFSLILAGVVFSQIKLKRKLKGFMSGKAANSLEESIASIVERNSMLEKTLAAHKEALEHLDARLTGTVRGLSLIRYDAYLGSGGTQSFAAGLINELGDGFVLSVVTNRNHVGVYAKEIKKFTPTVELTPEEKQALDEAKTNQTL